MMVNFCTVYDCSNRADRDKNTSFYRLPAVKINVREATKNLHEERRSLWLRRIQRTEINLSKFGFCEYAANISLLVRYRN